MSASWSRQSSAWPGTKNRATTTEYLREFHRLAPQIYLYQPKLDRTKRENQRTTDYEHPPAPDLIIMCTWLAASSRHIEKYTSSYLEKHLEVPIVLLRSSQTAVIFRGASKQQEVLQPAVTAIASVLDAIKERNEPRVLFHIFSNGGSWSACMLAASYRKIMGQTLPITALVFDSCPSLPHLVLSHRAVAAGLPRQILIRLIGSLLIWIIVLVVGVLNRLHITRNLIVELRRMLNEPASAFIKMATPRVYICSRTDAMVPLEDVQLHASQAKAVMGRAGLSQSEVDRRISFEEFKGSPHVGHLMVDKDRYWRIVDSVWREGIRVQEQSRG